MNEIEFYKVEWKFAEKDGNVKYAQEMKDTYRIEVMKLLIKPYHFWNEKTKAFPTVILN